MTVGTSTVGSFDEVEELARRFGAAEALEFASLVEEVDDAAAAEPDPSLAGVDDGELVERFCTDGAELSAAMCRWLQLLAEIVRRRIWVAHGARTPTEWLSYTVSMAPSTAREHVRVALRLRHFPATTRRFAAGQLSYSKVRAITRTGRPDLEDLLLRYATHATGAQLETILRGFRQVRRRQETLRMDAADLRGARLVELDDGTSEIRIRLPDTDALTAWAQLTGDADRLREEAVAARDPDEDAAVLPSRAQLVADAFVHATDRLASQPDQSADPHSERHTLVLHTDAAALDEDGDVPVRASAEARTRPMSSRAVRRLACDARLAIVAHDHDGNVVSASGATRKVPPRLRRMLRARDRGCRFPSCTATRGLDAHHVTHWADGGPTTLSNLLLLCRYHHRFLHERRWTITHDGHGHVRFRPPDAAPIPTVRTPPDPVGRYLDPDEHWPTLDATPDALRPDWDGTRPDIALAITVLHDALERLRPPDPALAPTAPTAPTSTAVAA